MMKHHSAEPTVGLALMSWKSAHVLERTLETYQRQNLFECFDQYCVLFQDVQKADKDLAAAYNLNYITTHHNVGIYGGVKRLAEYMTTDYILLLEDDCILIEDKATVIDQLSLAKKRLVSKQVDVYRLRHRYEPGEKFDTVEKFKRYHLCEGETFSFIKFVRSLMRPYKYRKLIGSAVYVHKNPSSIRYGKFIKKMPEGDFIISSRVLNWTNQSVLVSRKWLLETILPYVEENPSKRKVNGFQDIEKSLNCRWWRNQNFNIGVSDGLFSHQRLTT